MSRKERELADKLRKIGKIKAKVVRERNLWDYAEEIVSAFVKLNGREVELRWTYWSTSFTPTFEVIR